GAERRARLQALGSRHDQTLRQNWKLVRSKLAGQEQRLALLDPAATLERGYCLAWSEDGSLLHDARQIRGGHSLLLATSEAAVTMDIGEVAPVKHPLSTP
ncbi:MAG: hypothetical protein KGJ76_15340, partial [Betaproteobacteria bacterium]|nr:hypothetical protein [Betaproteobacteria bacterium]